jgi:hypothetical protein
MDDARRMTRAAAAACVEQLLGESLRQALPGMEEAAAAGADEVERLNAQVIIEVAREVVNALEQDVRAFREQGASEAPRDDQPRCQLCWRTAATRVSRVA